MNYLAHLYLAEDSPESILGNLLGDFVKGRLDRTYSPEIIRGIITHRKVDSFTDSHKLVLLSKRLISPRRRRFAGIIVDVSFDHFLARYWADYSSVELGFFTRRVYDLLKLYRDTLPEGLRSSIPRMSDEDWLGSYSRIEGVGAVLDRISRRFKRENGLKGSVEELESNYSALEDNFRAFFPELIAFVEDFRRNHGDSTREDEHTGSFPMPLCG